jgi:hypothetical protein
VHPKACERLHGIAGEHGMTLRELVRHILLRESVEERSPVERETYLAKAQQLYAEGDS